MSDCGCDLVAESNDQARVLWIILSINLLMFVIEVGAGLFADSLALLADSLDMLADATVYGVSLYAVRRGLRAKSRAAILSGYLQISLGLLVLLETVRRLIFAPTPEPVYMVAVSIAALGANIACLRLIAAHREGGVHMRASLIFSQNDVIANLSVILGGAFVWLTGWHFADLLVGAGIALLIASGGFRILREARESLAAACDSTLTGAA